jgi:hypothetical protein
MSLMCLSATKTLNKYTNVIDELYNIFCNVTDALEKLVVLLMHWTNVLDYP